MCVRERVREREKEKDRDRDSEREREGEGGEKEDQEWVQRGVQRSMELERKQNRTVWRNTTKTDSKDHVVI